MLSAGEGGECEGGGSEGGVKGEGVKGRGCGKGRWWVGGG